MNIAFGDIWDFSCLKVVPVNLGWTKRGYNVMGRGVAEQAARRYPDLPQIYGQFCQLVAKKPHDPVPLFMFNDLVLLPVKPLNREYPYLSWKQGASPELIERSLAQLPRFTSLRDVALPLVGCGNGGLDSKLVMPLIKKYLHEDRFTLVLLPGDPCIQ